MIPSTSHQRLRIVDSARLYYIQIIANSRGTNAWKHALAPIFMDKSRDFEKSADKNALYFKNYVCYNEGNINAVGESR